jgi:hypothetical protein
LVGVIYEHWLQGAMHCGVSTILYAIGSL